MAPKKSALQQALKSLLLNDARKSLDNWIMSGRAPLFGNLIVQLLNFIPAFGWSSAFDGGVRSTVGLTQLTLVWKMHSCALKRTDGRQKVSRELLGFFSAIYRAGSKRYVEACKIYSP